MVNYKPDDDLDLKMVLGIDERAGSNRAMLLTINRSWKILACVGDHASFRVLSKVK